MTVTGPGGVGKTRLAGEVAEQVAARFADGAWLVELAPVRDPAQVPAAVAAALGVREQPGCRRQRRWPRVLARLQLLLVLDNCEHVIGAAAELCGGLLQACDDLQILATSREPLAVRGGGAVPAGAAAGARPGRAGRGGRRRWRCSPTGPGGRPGFALNGQTGRWWRGWWRGWTGCRWRSSWRRRGSRRWGWPSCWTAWMTAGAAGGRGPAGGRAAPVAGSRGGVELPAAGRGRAAGVPAVSVFPAPFTLEAAEAVAGPGGGPGGAAAGGLLAAGPAAARPGWPVAVRDAGDAARLRGRAAGRGRGAGRGGSGAGRVRGAGGRAGRGGADDQRRGAGRGPVAGCRGRHHEARCWPGRWTTTRRWRCGWRPRWAGGGCCGAGWPASSRCWARLAGRAEPGSDGWCAAQLWLGWTALISADMPESLGHSPRSAMRSRTGGRPGCWPTAWLAGRSSCRTWAGSPRRPRMARRALALARELGYPAGEAWPWRRWAAPPTYRGDLDDAVRLARQAGQITAAVPGGSARVCSYLLAEALTEAGDLAAAEQVCAAALAQARDAGDLLNLGGAADADGGPGPAGWPHRATPPAHLREAAAARRADRQRGSTCSTAWTAAGTCAPRPGGTPKPSRCGPPTTRLTQHARAPDVTPESAPQGPLHEACQALGPARARAAEDRGAAMSLATAAEYALMLTAPARSNPGRRGRGR